MGIDGDGNRRAKRWRTTLMCCSSVVAFIFELSSRPGVNALFSRDERECTVFTGESASGH
ncbi:hypothetical protein [Rhodococcus jostii]|uniref:Uncharacterized protein n=1 Tax=Rhodococcus jostii TaxID=132919 RepID=A0A1H5MJS0_RHOJO|nr:hypothetical protein [Rhodococcus jostii]SEE88901.1 hypothetical protein SAMN04490220_9008 [Rhodococcus jostii]